ncbi:DUF1168 domain containing protein [Nitzschia inconspicua]|uniref:DUF1168 domain containing protein n=1 Tax=Nitzschia inconspicua TaxID=303405 RepID=A0A9K3LYJ8_9STRA|nr:DUF1168 domain containing protein [Nitzschia inconspicua]
MPRFTSVQAYADNNANLRKLTYEQATGSSGGDGDANKDDSKPVGVGGTVKPEKVVNPYGSAAGAGSGEFHIYRHARAREMKRWKELDEEQKQQLLDEEFKQQQQEIEQQLHEATAKRRKKRQREKEAKQRKKNLKAAGIDVGAADDDDKKNLTNDDDFTYVPEAKQQKTEETEREAVEPEIVPAPKEGDIMIKNDGSFLEMMKKRLQQDQEEQPQPKKLPETRIFDEDDEDFEGPRPVPPT